MAREECPMHYIHWEVELASEYLNVGNSLQGLASKLQVIFLDPSLGNQRKYNIIALFSVAPLILNSFFEKQNMQWKLK